MKNFIGILVLMFLPMQSFAQLKVFSSGNVAIQNENENSSCRLLVGSNPGSYPTCDIGIASRPSTTGAFNLGVYGISCPTSDSGNWNSMGVLGVAGNSPVGFNFGVLGGLANTTYNGAGIYGCTTGYLGSSVNGVYAGYFDGATRVAGTLTANSYLTPSDMRLKENVVSLKNTNSSTLDNLQVLDVIEYNYKPSNRDDVYNTKLALELGIEQPHETLSKTRHLGLSAQDLQTIYPNLVEKSQDGYLAINYVELVPVLIRAIQELKIEVDALQGNTDKAVQRAPAGIDIRESAVSGNALYQNAPNPFKEQTIIRFKLADNVEDAAICIFDMQGKMLQNLPISSGMESVSVNGYELGKGLFLYSLVVNGQEIDTKKMIISK